MKQVIVVNDSLKLPKGKLAAQVAHAAVASFLITNSKLQNQWLKIGMPKIVLKANNEEDLIELQKQAEQRDIPTHLIRDAVKTVTQSGTITCLGLGPAAEQVIDSITSDLNIDKNMGEAGTVATIIMDLQKGVFEVRKGNPQTKQFDPAHYEKFEFHRSGGPLLHVTLSKAS